MLALNFFLGGGGGKGEKQFVFVSLKLAGLWKILDLGGKQ